MGRNGKIIIFFFLIFSSLFSQLQKKKKFKQIKKNKQKDQIPLLNKPPKMIYI